MPQSPKELLVSELRQSRAAYLEACLEWSAHPCPGHLYNLELFKKQLGDTFARIKQAGLWTELVGHLHPAPVLNPSFLGEDDEKAVVARVERHLRSALASTSVAVLLLEGLGVLSPYAPSVAAFKALFDALGRWRKWLMERGVTYPRGFSPGCCQVRDTEDCVLRADTVVEKYLAVG